MNAGQTNIKVGTKVKIKQIKGEDADLSGKTGTVTHPFAFGCAGKNWVGIWIDSPRASGIDNCNVRVSEIDFI